MGTRVNLLQLRNIVFPGAPETVSRQRDWVCYAEVVERAEKLFFECFGQANFSGETVAKIRRDAGAIHSLWGCCQSQKYSWAESLKNRSIADCGTVMHFIHDDKV